MAMLHCIVSEHYLSTSKGRKMKNDIVITSLGITLCHMVIHLVRLHCEGATYIVFHCYLPSSTGEEDQDKERKETSLSLSEQP